MMKNAKKITQRVFIARNAAEPFALPVVGGGTAGNKDFWRWGDDNLFPVALSAISRQSVAHRRILNDKSYYISGKGFSFDDAVPGLAALVAAANGGGETLRQVLAKLAFDKMMFGNAFLEVATDPTGSFLSLFHQDASRCRLAKAGSHVILHHDWTKYDPKQAQRLPLFPAFEAGGDGTLRSVIHFKEYEPMYQHYGVPSYIAGLNVTAIAWKTDNWNISRLDNAFQLSGVMMLDASVDNDAEASELVRTAETKFAGKPGQVMFIVREGEGDDNSRFIPINSANDGDWKALHEQSMADIVVAHSWFRSLSGLDYSGGFSAERILHEYEVALNTAILTEQAELMEPIRAVVEHVLRVDASSLQVVNLPPTQAKPAYMRIWEARKADGLDFDPADPAQQLFLSQIDA